MRVIMLSVVAGSAILLGETAGRWLALPRDLHERRVPPEPGKSSLQVRYDRRLVG